MVDCFRLDSNQPKPKLRVREKQLYVPKEKPTLIPTRVGDSNAKKKKVWTGVDTVLTLGSKLTSLD